MANEISHMRTVDTVIATAALFFGIDAMAQESRSEVSMQGSGFFAKDTAGQGTTERTTNRVASVLSAKRPGDRSPSLICYFKR
jgi:hypothetical protein